MKATDAILKWTPTVQRRAADNIISSNYTTAKVFIPSYEKEVRPRIEQLLTNDYQRIWWKEKRVWDKMIAEKTVNRRILPRMLIKKKVPTCVTIKYQPRTDRWMGKEKQNPKSDSKKKDSEKNIEELKSAKDNTKLEECEEAKSERHEKIQSESEKESENKKEKKKEEESLTD